MNNSARFWLGILLAGSLAALATPELTGHINVVPGLSTILAAGLGEMLRRLNASMPAVKDETKCEHSDSASE